MQGHTRFATPPVGDPTWRCQTPLDDTQPVPRAVSPYQYSPYTVALPFPEAPARRFSCLPSLIAALVVFLCLVGGLIVGGYIWRSATTAPRSTILILGLDRRPDQGYVTRSDTMILMTVYPPGPRIVLLSIPRDLYVNVPGYGQDRINTAHFWGESESPGGGPTLALQTVAQNLGVPVEYYVRVDFDGFRAIVDAVGGIDVMVEQPVVDDAYPTDDYGTMRIEIPAGPQHMDGETALRYARSRHGASDFDRTERQQQVITALARRLFEPAVWPRWPAVYRVVADHVDTNLTIEDMLLLAPTFYRVGIDGIEHRAITRDMTEPWTTPSGGAVLLPRWEMIHPLIQELFTP